VAALAVVAAIEAKRSGAVSGVCRGCLTGQYETGHESRPWLILVGACFDDTAGMSSNASVPPVKVFLIEDFVPIRERLGALVCTVSGTEIVGEADEPVGALAGIESAKPDVVVVDLQLKSGTSGLTVLKELAARGTSIVSIVLTNSPYPQVRRACLSAGAHYFFDKTSEFGLIRQVVQDLADDNRTRSTVE
jgi:CheY-like chemotaxis protein